MRIKSGFYSRNSPSYEYLKNTKNNCEKLARLFYLFFNDKWFINICIINMRFNIIETVRKVL